MSAASELFEAATRGGYQITPQAIAEAIRAAAMKSRDENGQINISKLYELTCEIESLKS